MHDYERNDTCDLFAALAMASGSGITDIRESHSRFFVKAFMPCESVESLVVVGGASDGA